MVERPGLSYEQQRAELMAELRACPIPRDRAIMRAELATLEARLAQQEAQAEQLTSLPEFWRDIYGEEPGFVALFSGIRPAPSAKLEETHAAYFAWPHETAAALAWIVREAAEDRDLYHCGHLVKRWRRRKADAMPLAALYADLDTGLSDHALVIPSALVESSPGHYQAYLRLTRRVAPADGADLNRRLAQSLHGDPGGWDLTQLFRVPSTVNHKYGERPLVRLVALTGQVYEPAELDRLLPPLPAPVGGERTITNAGGTPPVGSDPPIPLTRSALRVWNGQDAKRNPTSAVDRSASLIRIARILYQAGIHREHLVAVLAERDASLGWNKYSGRKDATEQYHRIVDVVERGKPTRRQ